MTKSRFIDGRSITPSTYVAKSVHATWLKTSTGNPSYRY